MRFRDRALTVLLVIVILAMAFTVVRREFAPDLFRHAGPVPVPEYVVGWEELEVLGATVVPSAAPRSVTIVEFVDFECPYCRETHASLQRLRDRYPGALRLVYVHLPLSYHEHAESAARLFECSRGHAPPDRVADVLFENQSRFDEEDWLGLAVEAGAPASDELRNCLGSEARVPAIEEGRAAATRFGVTATPTLIVDGWRFQGTPSERLIRSLINDLLAGRTPATPPEMAVGQTSVREDTASGVVSRTYSLASLLDTPVLEVVLEPLVVLSAEEMDGSDYDLSSTSFLVRLRSGGLVTYSRRDASLQLFGADGVGRRILGRQGEGPGDYIRVGSLLLAAEGDTVIAVDRGTNRITWVTPAGGAVRMRRIPDAVPIRFGRSAGLLDGRRLVLHDAGITLPGVPDSVSRPLARIGLLDPDGSWRVIADIPDVEVIQRQMRYAGVNQPESFAVRYGLRAQIATVDGMVAIATWPEFRVDLIDDDGNVRRRVVTGESRRPVTEQLRRSAIEADLATLRSSREQPVDRAESERAIKEQPFADSLPPIAGLLGSGSTVWALRPTTPFDAGWTAVGISADGHVTGRIHSAVSGTPVWIDDEAVVLRTEDEYGLVRYAVHAVRAREK